MTPFDNPPHPRLWHCKPGSTITLEGEHRSRTILHFEGKHVRFTDGLLVTRCHLVRRECMQFGDGAGWRPLSTPTVSDPVHNLGTDAATPCFAGDYDLLVTE